MEKEGAEGSKTLEELIQKLSPPRVVWMMYPAGELVDETVSTLSSLLSKDDIIVEGGNSYYKDDIRRARALKTQGIHYVDAGVSGGIWGLKVGYCTMIGGDESDFRYIEPLLKTLAPPDGYLYCGSTGAGHFVKMIHNGIEYAIMEAYGEGFELLKSSPYGENLELDKVAHLWNQGSVVRSWLLELPDAYERLLLDCMLSDQTLFWRSDDVESAWSFVTPVLDKWESEPECCPLTFYESGSWGPHESAKLLEHDGREWR
jgi:6-phosphogluconate dehydrogenase